MKERKYKKAGYYLTNAMSLIELLHLDPETSAHVSIDLVLCLIKLGNVKEAKKIMATVHEIKDKVIMIVVT